MGQGGEQAAVVDGEHMQAITEAEQACTVPLENKVNMATVEIQNMKPFMQTMAEVVQAMQSMMMSNATVGSDGPRVCCWIVRVPAVVLLATCLRDCIREGQPSKCLAQA